MPNLVNNDAKPTDWKTATQFMAAGCLVVVGMMIGSLLTNTPSATASGTKPAAAIPMCGRLDSVETVGTEDRALMIKFFDLRAPIFLKGAVSVPLWRGNIVRFELQRISSNEYSVVSSENVMGKCPFDGEPDSVSRQFDSTSNPKMYKK